MWLSEKWKYWQVVALNQSSEWIIIILYDDEDEFSILDYQLSMYSEPFWKKNKFN